MDKTLEKIVAERCTYTHKGKQHQLNVRMVIERNFSGETIDTIIELHRKRWDIVDEMAANVSSVSFLRQKAQEHKEINFELQRLWGFELDSNKHLWYELPGCTCPKMDNRDLGGHGSIISADCPIHGS